MIIHAMIHCMLYYYIMLHYIILTCSKYNTLWHVHIYIYIYIYTYIHYIILCYIVGYVILHHAI